MEGHEEMVTIDKIKVYTYFLYQLLKCVWWIFHSNIDSNDYVGLEKWLSNHKSKKGIKGP